MTAGLVTAFSIRRADMERRAALQKINIANYMAAPITPIEKLSRDKDEMRTRMELMIMKVQADLCKTIEGEENFGKKFKVDRWERKEGGGGVTCIIQDGDVFEKAGVNVSVVSGMLPPGAVQQMKARGRKLSDGELPFFAAGE